MSKEIEKWKREDYDNMDTETLIQLLVDKDDYFEELTTPPTEQEVCEALDKWSIISDEPFDEKVCYEEQMFFYGNSVICGLNYHNLVFINYELPPHLVELIGKFYKGKVKE